MSKAKPIEAITQISHSTGVSREVMRRCVPWPAILPSSALMTVSHVREVLLAAVMALSATTGLAQTTATLAGTIQDVAGNVLPGADISIVNAGTGAAR